ncbi:MAG: Na+/H+ antiporter subunit E [Anaerolineae bacterium]|nr:Na+/H+ antiporter subunit E [Anaerolineae bacterium]
MVRSFLLNIFLALVWTFLQGELQGSNFALGLVLGYLVIALSQQVLGASAYVRKVGQVMRFLLFAIWEIFTASLALAWLIMQPRLRLRPGIVAIPLDAETDMEIVAVSSLITLSPGTMSLDVSTDRRTLYVHTIDLGDPDAFRREIKEGLERQVLEVMR